MLMIFDTFMMRYGIRSAQYLAKPNITRITNFHLPRNVVIHYLDQTIDAMFPNRNMYYFSEVEESKKIRILNITDLTRKEGTTTLNNRFLGQDIRQWVSSHRSTFRVQDLINEPQDDEQNTGIVNYNPVKDLYNYRSSLVAQYDKTYNLMTTIADTLSTFVKKDNKNTQLVTLQIPNNIPGFVYMNRLMSFSSRKLTEVIEEDSLYWVFEFYKWLTKEYRRESIFKNITDEDSKRILLEIKFRGYATYVKLSTIRALSEDSQLESSRKFNDTKLLKFFLTFLMRLQEEITNLNVAGIESTAVLEDDSDKEEVEDDEEERDEDAHKELELNNSIQTNNKIPEDPSEDTRDIDEIEDIVFDGISDGEIDDIFKDVDKYDKVGLDKLEQIESGQGKKSLIEHNKTLGDKEVEETEEDEEVTEEEQLLTLTPEEEEQLLAPKSPDVLIDEFIKKGEVTGTLAASEIKSLRTAQEKRKRLKEPYTNKPVDEFKPGPEDDVELNSDVSKIPLKDAPVEENMLTDKTTNFDKIYVEKTMKKDIVASVMSLENSGAVITDYTTEVVKSSVDHYEIHRFEMRPINGKSTPLYFRLPVVDEEGSFMVGGRKYRLRKTKQDLPIRKISSTRVALTSNYGKFFVSRTPRKAYDGDTYVVEFIRNDYLEGTGNVTKIVPGRKRLNLIENLPNLYYKLASEFDKVETKKYTFLFNRDEVHSTVADKDLKKIESNGRVFMGYTNKDKNLVTIDKSGNLFNATKNEMIGSLITELEIDPNKVPRSFSSMTVVGKEIPFGVVMGYYIGLNNLVKLTKTKFRLMPSNKRFTPANLNEVELRFSDFRLILDLDTEEKRLIFQGYLYYRDFIKLYKLRSFDSKDIYLNLIEFRGAALYNLKELDNLDKLFLDPITVDVLEEIKEPTEFRKLLLRANEMLASYDYPDINDPRYSRIRGYDRLPGLMYRALAETMREHNLKGNANSRLSLDPYKVWNYVTQDSSKQPREALNPIASIKEDEIITLTGRDGLSTSAVPKEMRRYHKYDTGLVSESTSDSKNVAISAGLSPYAKLKNTRGLVEPNFDEIEENPAKLFSTTIQLCPMSEYDNGPRLNMTGIQMSHTVPSSGYKQPVLRTGYEYVLPYKTGDNFCKMAFEDGVVTKVTNDTLSVKYKSGLEETYTIGSVYTNYEGVDYKNNLNSLLKAGDKFKQGDNLYYHEDFFEPDWLDKTKIVYKTNKIYTVALVSNAETYEDSSAISPTVMKEITTSVLKERSFILNFDTNIDQIVNVGDEVYPNDTLFIDSGDSFNAGNLNEAALSLLESIASMSPRAKYRGVIDRIEIKYNGDVSDMSPTLAKLATKLDKELYQKTKGTRDEARDNKVTGEYTSNGKKLDIDSVELKFYINVVLDMAIGDKLVVANQAKSVVGEVFYYNLEGNESHDKVDVMMATIGFIHRVIDSPIRMGTVNRLTRHVSKQAADIYFGK